VLTSSFPLGLVDEMIEAAGRASQHHRLLLAQVVV
jgi:hypothetical protein